MKKIILTNKYTKRILYAFFFLFLLGKNFLYAQKVGINTSAPTNDLHIISTADPVRLIGMQTGSNADSIVTINSIGLLKRRNTNTLFNSFAWRLVGNAGTNPTTNFLGTTDAQDLVFRTNNTEKVRITSGGNIGIGITVPTQKIELFNGNFLINNNNNTAGELRFAEPSTSGANYSSFRAQAQAVDVTYTLPSGAGITGQQLTTDGVGNLSWTNPSAATTNTLSLAGNTLTSTVNGVAATSNTVSTVANTSSANTLSTTVNGIAGTPINIINSNATSLSGTNLTTTVNGVASTPLDLTPAIGLTAWRLLGNAGTNPAVNFVGTTDAQPLALRTNNVEKVRIGTDGALNLRNGNSSGNTQNQLLMGWFGSGNYDYTHAIKTRHNSGAAIDNAIDFYVWKAGTDAIATPGTQHVMSLQGTNNGSVGIGTTNPEVKLDVAGSLLFSDNVTTKQYFNLHTYDNNVASITGSLQIAMPKTWSNTMMQIKVQGYNYAAGSGAWELIVGGYNYSSPAGWYNTSATLKGSPPFTSVRLAHNGTTNVLILGDVATSWAYPKVTVTEFKASYLAYTNWGTGWSSTLSNTEATITNAINLDLKTYEAINGNFGIGTTTPSQKLEVLNGNILLNNTNNTATELRFDEPSSAGNNFTAFKAQAQGADITYTLPAAIGSSGQQLTTDGVGNLSWTNPSAATTNTLSLAGNTLTSTVNGVAATSNAVSTVANTSSANTLSTTVNGIAGTPVNIINSNATSLSGSSLTTTVNGIASTPVDLSPVVGLSAWRLLGNAATNPATNFVGTTDAQDLSIRTNNTEKVRVTSGGNIGIGTATPAYKLDLAQGTFGFGTGNARTETRADAGLQGNAGAQSGFFETSTPSNYPTGATSWWHLIDSRHGNTGNNYAMQISGSFFDQEIWYRKTNNNPATPWNRFVTSNNFSSFGWALLGNAGTNPTTNFLGTTDAQDLVFRTNNTEKVRVTSAGNVGIGIAAPTAKLHIIDGGLEVKASSATGFQVETAGATAWTNLGTSTTAPILQWYNSVNTGLGVISATGRMGVGTITPANKLHIIGEDNAADTEISSTLANNQTQGVAIKYGGIAKTGSNAVSSLDINAKGAGNIILHATASGATTSTGNVGIGTAAPAVTLDMGTRTDAVLMPRGTSAERPAAPQTGMLRYNSSLGRMEYWNGTAWVIL